MLEPRRITERLDGLLREIGATQVGGFRFGAKVLAVSEIASQYYCEKAVELGRIHGKRETPEMKIGGDAHEILLKDAIRAKREKILREIYSGKPVGVREMPLIGKHGDAVIVGITDAILFSKRLPVLLVEHKFSMKHVPFASHHVQARLYCYLLYLMGWNIDQLKYAIVMASPSLEDDPELRRIPLHVMWSSKEERMLVKLARGNAHVYINSFDIDKAVADLDWALGFWRKLRRPVPTKKSAKCKVCEFGDECDSSQRNNL